MNDEIEIKLDYLMETKNQIKQSISSLNNNITDDDPFSVYPDKIQDIISAYIIPQSTLNIFMEKIIAINN